MMTDAAYQTLLANALRQGAAATTPDEDRAAVALLDTAYQAAVERNDAAGVAAIQTPDMILVLGDGRVVTGEELITHARTRLTIYDLQAEAPGTQTVRLFGRDTAVVTALLPIRGQQGERQIDIRLWFSDTYIRTHAGWRYAFGQASLPLTT